MDGRRCVSARPEHPVNRETFGFLGLTHISAKSRKGGSGSSASRSRHGLVGAFGRGQGECGRAHEVMTTMSHCVTPYQIRSPGGIDTTWVVLGPGPPAMQVRARPAWAAARADTRGPIGPGCALPGGAAPYRAGLRPTGQGCALPGGALPGRAAGRGPTGQGRAPWRAPARLSPDARCRCSPGRTIAGGLRPGARWRRCPRR